MQMNGARFTESHSNLSLLSASHLAALRKRGLTDATIQEAGLWSANEQQVAEILHFDPGTEGIVIPYYHPITGEVVMNRIRPDRLPVIGGKAAKYLSPRGAGNRLYFPPGAREWIIDPSIPIGLTEGEFKVLWTYQVGLRYIGLIGVWGWRGKKCTK